MASWIDAQTTLQEVAMKSASQTLSPLALQAIAQGVQTLAPGQALTLRPARAGVLRVQRGALWVTRGGPHGDEFLRPGQCLPVRAGEQLVVEPIAVGGTPLQRVALDWQARTDARWSADVARPATELRRALRDAAVAGRRLARGLLAWALHRPSPWGEVG